MTRERALELADEYPDEDLIRELLADLILKAVAEEREACAKIADDYMSENYDDIDSVFIAARIRERN